MVVFEHRPITSTTSACAHRPAPIGPSVPRSGVQGASDVLHGKNGVPIVGRARLELGDEIEGEVADVARPGMDEQTSTADVGRQLEWSGNDVLEKSHVESPTFMVGIDTPTRARSPTGRGWLPAPLRRRRGAGPGGICAKHQA